MGFNMDDYVEVPEPRRREDLAWATGIFEGEGCISIHAKRNGICMVSMTDFDVVQRFQYVMGFGKLYQCPPKAGYHKPLLRWSAHTFEQVQATVALLWPWLGVRRRTRALEVLTVIRTGALACKDRTHCPKGHPYSGPNLRISGGRRMCKTCRGEAGFR